MSKSTHITTSPDKGAAPPGGRPQTYRVAPALRQAIKLRVEKGLTIGEACEKAGISEAGWYKAMQRQAVIDHYNAVEANFVKAIDQRRKGYRARAFEVAAEIMERGTSEAARLRAVELFTREEGQPLVNIAINPQAASAYTYRKPGKDGTPIDSPSIALDGQAIDITPLSESE